VIPIAHDLNHGRRQLCLFAGRIASGLKGSMRPGAVSLVEGIFFQVIFTRIVKCNQ